MESSFSPKNTLVAKKMEGVKKSPTLTAQKRMKKASVGSPDDLSHLAPLELPKPAVAVDESSINTDPKPLTQEAAPEADSEAIVAAPKVPEPILTPTEERFVIFPIKHGDLWAKYKQHMAVFWTPEEIDLSKDLKDWEKLNAGEQHFIKHILGFFAGSDGIVMENLASRFMREVQLPEAKFFYSCQNLLEAIHSETYSLLIDNYIQDKKEKNDLLHAIQTIPSVKKKADWALQWIDSEDADFATRLLAFACVEGIFFSGAFCAIFWFKQRGIMPGLTLSNEFIARDEGLHTEFACLLYSKIVNRLPKQKVHKMVREAVKIEKHFITKALPCELIGMNADLMCQYIEFVADRLMLQVGYPKIYRSANPFPFMENMSLENKDNFFEKRVSTYAKATVGKDPALMTFATNADF
jgi:ribonucleotide reductase beta subunit family protein with ferritin-like domain